MCLAYQSGTPSGYYQDATGKWHRPDGQFASNTEVGLPSNSDHYLNEKSNPPAMLGRIG